MEDIPAIKNCDKTLTFTSITVQTPATITTMWKNIICIIHCPPMQQVSLISSATFPLYIDILLKVEFMKVYMGGMLIYLESGKSRATDCCLSWWYILNQENQDLPTAAYYLFVWHCTNTKQFSVPSVPLFICYVFRQQSHNIDIVLTQNNSPFHLCHYLSVMCLGNNSTTDKMMGRRHPSD